MSRFKFSEMLPTIKRTTTLNKWVDTLKDEIKEKTYEKRDVINKKELNDELSRLDKFPELWTLFKKLYKKDNDYDVLVSIDKYGYLTLEVVFPITRKEYDKVIENKHEWTAKNGKFYSSCFSMPEGVYKVTHERIEKIFNGFQLVSNGSYAQYNGGLIRVVDLH